MTTKLDLQVPVSKRDHLRGPADARVTLVEYGDFDCPYCQAAQPAIRALLKHFGPDLRFAFRQNPLGDLHQHARVAAQAAEAATLQGKFWAMYDRLFSHPKELDEASLARHAAALGLEPGRFADDLHSPAVLAHIREDEVGGLRSGVIGTPTFFIDGVHFRDKPDFETLERAIEARLEHAGPARKAPIRRRDGSGHLDPKYRAKLLAASGHAREPGDDHAFLTGARSSDAFAEKLGEENGGPFLETSGSTEFAHGTDASNIAGATREPFPRT
jgi:protein-disulfide isomerase